MQRVIVGDALESLRNLPPNHVQCIITSPPYWGQRDYGNDRQIGLEPEEHEYVSRIVDVFEEAKRVLRDDGTLWLNIGDAYLKKRLLGLPWRIALALQDTGWILRSEIIWHKTAPMPEGVSDRPVREHEHVFLLSKKERYLYNRKAVQVPTADIKTKPRNFRKTGQGQVLRQDFGRPYEPRAERDLRTVWTINPARCKVGETHFAVFPEKLVNPCVLAGSMKGSTVLDPFCGTGTVGVVARRHFREFIGIEINPKFAAFAEDRIERQTAHHEMFEENEDE